MEKENQDSRKEQENKAEQKYSRWTRIMELYIVLCFLLVTVVPLFEYSWVAPFVRFIYFTGFPMLVVLILFSLVKDAMLDTYKRRQDVSTSSAKPTGRK